MRQAASFADAALRRVLEVIDRRRPVAQLHGLLAAGLADSVLSANQFTACDNGVGVAPVAAAGGRDAGSDSRG
jgi:hypothetical protein